MKNMEAEKIRSAASVICGINIVGVVLLALIGVFATFAGRNLLIFIGFGLICAAYFLVAYTIKALMDGLAELIDCQYNSRIKTEENNCVLKDIKQLLAQQVQRQEESLVSKEPTEKEKIEDALKF